MDRSFQGKCYCEAVQFEVSPPTKFVAHCHCENCRRAHGAAFVTWAGYLKKQFNLVKGEENLGRYKTETQATRSFCTNCGSTLFFESPRWDGEIHIARVFLPEELDLSPQAHVYFECHPSWLEIRDDLKKLGGEDGISELSL